MNWLCKSIAPMLRMAAVLSISFAALGTGPAIAQNSTPLDPYDSVVRADLEYACAEEIRLAEATSRGTAWFQSAWVSQFKKFQQPGIFFDRIRKEDRPQWIPFHYLKACAAFTYAVQSKNGVGSGKEALERWQKLRAHFEQSLASGAGRPANPSTDGRANLAATPQRSSASPSEATQVPSGASNATITKGSTGSNNKWPEGVEPGNLYLIDYTTIGVTRTTGITHVPGQMPIPLIVAAKSRNDAVALLEAKWAEYKRAGRYGPDDKNLVLNVRQECTGPNWGAIVRWDSRWGSVCGAKTPREAILEATKACSRKNGISCDREEGREWLNVFIGHSGAKPWRDPVFGSSFPTMQMQTSALGAGTSQSTNEVKLVRSPQEAIDQFGKACINDPQTTKSCWVTSKNIKCLFNIDIANQHRCIDTKLTADGYLP